MREHNTSVAQAASGSNSRWVQVNYEAIFIVPLHQPVPPGQAGKACSGPHQLNTSDQWDPERQHSSPRSEGGPTLLAFWNVLNHTSVALLSTHRVACSHGDSSCPKSPPLDFYFFKTLLNSFKFYILFSCF